MAEHWQIVDSRTGKASTTPEELWDAATSYFHWCDNNPLKAKRIVTAGKSTGQSVNQEYNRPYSVKGMCLHCGISEKYINDIKNVEGSNDWLIVIEKILMIIYTQNLEGAIVDLYNPIMVSKVLNLDKPDQSGQGNSKVEIIDSTSNQLATSENEVLRKLDFEKTEIIKDKSENSQREIGTHKDGTDGIVKVRGGFPL